MKKLRVKYAEIEPGLPGDYRVPQKYLYESSSGGMAFELTATLKCLIRLKKYEDVDEIFAMNFPYEYRVKFYLAVGDTFRGDRGRLDQERFDDFLGRVNPRTRQFLLFSIKYTFKNNKEIMAKYFPAPEESKKP